MRREPVVSLSLAGCPRELRATMVQLSGYQRLHIDIGLPSEGPELPAAETTHACGPGLLTDVRAELHIHGGANRWASEYAGCVSKLGTAAVDLLLQIDSLDASVMLPRIVVYPQTTVGIAIPARVLGSASREQQQLVVQWLRTYSTRWLHLTSPSDQRSIDEYEQMFAAALLSIAAIETDLGEALEVSADRGITVERARVLFSLGICRIVVGRAVFNAHDPITALHEFVSIVHTNESI